MILYDKEISGFLESLSEKNIREFKRPDTPWKLLKRERLILKSEMACELGGGEHAAVSCIAFTSAREPVPKDGVFLVGPDLNAIRGDISYARIVLIRLNEEKIADSKHNGLYETIRRVDYTRYHVFPEGYAMRISASREREAVRISKQAMKEHISFQGVGWNFIDSYKQNPAVEAVRVYFLTDPSIRYPEVLRFARSCEEITASMDQIFRGLSMDCASCGQKELCDRIDGLRSLHEDQLKKE